MSRPNIVFTLYNMPQHGTYWRASYFARHLTSRGYKVTILLTSSNQLWTLKENKEYGYKIVEFPDIFTGSIRSGWDLINSFRRIFWLKTNDFDLLHSVETRPVVLFPSIWAKYNRKTVVFDWCDWLGKGGAVEDRTNPFARALLSPIETFLENNFRKIPDSTITINFFLARRAIALGAKPHTVFTIRNGCDTNIKPLPTSLARKKLGLPNDVSVIGYLGSMYNSDAKFMAKAFDYLQKNNKKTFLILIGYFNRSIEKYTESTEKIYRTGRLDSDNILLSLSACDILWLPMLKTNTNIGRWPGKLNNYLSMGKPIVASGPQEVVDILREHNAGIVALDNPVDFAVKTEILLQSEKLQSFLSRNARHLAETTLSWEKVTDNLEKVYDFALRNRPGFGA